MNEQYVKTVTYVSVKNKDYYVVQEFGFWISKPLRALLEHNFEVYDEQWNPLYKYTYVENETLKEEFIREKDKQC